MADDCVVTNIDLAQCGLKKIASGKVREIFEIDSDTLLFVATDRISAFDVILANGIPKKGTLLTQLSKFWFDLIRSKLPQLRTHLISTTLPNGIPEPLQTQLQGRSMQVRRFSVIPLESIVRGYITGSAWAEYKSKGTVHGMSMPSGLKESQKLEKAIWTPSTKAEAGQHDENISKKRVLKRLWGWTWRGGLREVSLRIYEMARDYAEERGILIADTKLEFGLDPSNGEIVLIDEVLTPDSSRFWPADKYDLGKSQMSYDKQYLRDWLVSSGLKGRPGVEMPSEVVQETTKKYREAYVKLTGHSL